MVLVTVALIEEHFWDDGEATWTAVGEFVAQVADPQSGNVIGLDEDIALDSSAEVEASPMKKAVQRALVYFVVDEAQFH